MSLVSKDEPLTTSVAHIGYLVLKEFEKTNEDRLSLTSITACLKKKDISQYRPIMFALMFLYVAGAIDFKAPYVYKL